ncbi:MAG: hypothetical protein ACLFPL_05720 [Candidatus Nanoarchaeia archaeon]
MRAYFTKQFGFVITLFFICTNIMLSLGFAELQYSAEEYQEFVLFSSIIDNENYLAERISIDIVNDEILRGNEEIIVEFMFNENMLESRCEFESIFENENSYQKKVYCPIPKQSEKGVYTLRLLIQSTEETQKNPFLLDEIEFFYSPNTVQYPLRFQNTPQGTKVIISINSENRTQTQIIHHDIPTQVITEITPENKDQLISSQREFEIINSNPIISWEVGPEDEMIEYTLLNTTVDEQTKTEFNTYEYEKDIILTQGVVAIILLLLLFIFVPFFMKSKHS